MLADPRFKRVLGRTHADYEPLTTQIYFEGDEYNESDPWWDAALTIPLVDEAGAHAGRPRRHGVFDITMRARS